VEQTGRLAGRAIRPINASESLGPSGKGLRIKRTVRSVAADGPVPTWRELTQKVAFRSAKASPLSRRETRHGRLRDRPPDSPAEGGVPVRLVEDLRVDTAIGVARNVARALAQKIRVTPAHSTLWRDIWFPSERSSPQRTRRNAEEEGRGDFGLLPLRTPASSVVVLLLHEKGINHRAYGLFSGAVAILCR